MKQTLYTLTATTLVALTACNAPIRQDFQRPYQALFPEELLFNPYKDMEQIREPGNDNLYTTKLLTLAAKIVGKEARIKDVRETPLLQKMDTIKFRLPDGTNGYKSREIPGEFYIPGREVGIGDDIWKPDRGRIFVELYNPGKSTTQLVEFDAYWGVSPYPAALQTIARKADGKFGDGNGKVSVGEAEKCTKAIILEEIVKYKARTGKQ
ncbi:hypothetical protein HYV86_02820 [Candidatus Woesearchaeota archaeon]|nr:hypothetical protein [Candidatus Woesearchaeota archaeon]